MTLPVLILTPLVASVIQILVGRRLPRRGDWLCIGGLTVSWFLALTLFIPLFLGGAAPSTDHPSLAWLDLGARSWTLGVTADPLQVALFFVVATVSLLVHIYSSGYMHDHDRYSRFFALISFFTFAMFGLVGADNFVYLFICWELMGFCSYMLIGFYFEEAPAYRAAIKAFLTTRIGDVALVIGLAILYTFTGDLTFSGLAAAVDQGLIPQGALVAASLLILSGAIGKSAQFPLHTWLPDAMEGPSPVSALIHAATMVAAGIYLVGRSIAVGLFPPEVLAITALVGSFTAIFAASMALAEYDFKKILAYSTISQLGFMLTALGVAGWTAGFFHLATHAFFKALLFLGSGAVLHAVHTRDMKLMGGLRTRMPITYATMMIGSLALVGFPFLSGFYSKDAILAAALLWAREHGGWHWVPFLYLAITAVLTAFYTFRMMILVFHGEPRDHHRADHAHEAPRSMTSALVVLAVLAVTFGWSWARTPFETLVVLPERSAAHAAPADDVILPDPAITTEPAGDEAPAAALQPAALPQAGGGAASGHGDHAGADAAHAAHLHATILSVVAVLLGIGGAFAVYHYRKVDASIFTRGPFLAAVHTVLVRHYWVDEAYALLVAAFTAFSRLLGWFDRAVIDRIIDAFAPALVGSARASGVLDGKGVDGLVNATADATQASGRLLRLLQSGRIQDYALGAMTAVLLLALWLSL